jgi:hypothetical protein
MTQATPNDLAGVESPMTFLRQQAALLAKETGGLVEAEVTGTAEVTGFASQLLSAGSDEPVIVLAFVLRAPALADYRYALFRAYHAVDQVYPLVSRFNGNEILIASPEKLAEHLRSIFSANDTRNILSTLIAQSKAMAS